MCETIVTGTPCIANIVLNLSIIWDVEVELTEWTSGHLANASTKMCNRCFPHWAWSIWSLSCGTTDLMDTQLCMYYTCMFVQHVIVHMCDCLLCWFTTECEHTLLLSGLIQGWCGTIHGWAGADGGLAELRQYSWQFWQISPNQHQGAATTNSFLQVLSFSCSSKG